MLFDYPITVNDLPLSLTQVISIARRWVLRSARDGKGLIVVDYLQIVECDQRAENRNVEVQKITAALKRLARETNMPVVAASQLRRIPGRDHQPALSDLRESGAQEADADKVILLHNPPNRELDGSGRYKAKIIIAKHRNGPTGAFEAWFTPECARFDNYTDEYGDGLPYGAE